MKTKASLQPNDKLEFTVRLTAPVEDWKALLRQLSKLNEGYSYYSWPLSTVVAQIQDVMERLDKTYHSDAGNSPQEIVND